MATRIKVFRHDPTYASDTAGTVVYDDANGADTNTSVNVSTTGWTGAASPGKPYEVTVTRTAAGMTESPKSNPRGINVITASSTPSVSTQWHSGHGDGTLTDTVTVTSAANRYLIAFCAYQTTNVTPDGPTFDGIDTTSMTPGQSSAGVSGLTWTLRIRSSIGSLSGNSGTLTAVSTVLTAPVSSSLNAYGFQIATFWGSLLIVQADNVGSIGAAAATANTAANGPAAVSITPQATGSRLVARGFIYNDGTSRTVAADCTLLGSGFPDGGNSNVTWAQYLTAATQNTSSTTLATTNAVGGGDPWQMAAIELRAA